jgi:uncharacterized protein YndB with AHSA1/START domain
LEDALAHTKKHDWSQFVLRIFINKPVSRVFEAWTNDKIVSKWFTIKTVIEPKKNGRIYFEWLAGDKMEAKVLSISKNRFFTFPFGNKGEKVTVRFRKDGKGCVCELHQFDMPTTPISRWNMHRGCLQGWTFFMTNLKSFLEHGIDLRGFDPKKSYRQDYINS